MTKIPTEVKQHIRKLKARIVELNMLRRVNYQRIVASIEDEIHLIAHSYRQKDLMIEEQKRS